MSLPELTREDKAQFARACFSLSCVYAREGKRFGGFALAVLQDGYRLAVEAGLNPQRLHLEALQRAGMAS